ncbi:hypothetical protein KYK30_31745 [Shinella yambaruensis]|uniref:Uncharacterized protein n=1 Tax=Shinella yambaruensis TaxID=415996 RepID=A0ABQ5ZTS0_9HYPH|nr:hypothetical protein [Shinella yambaruensis]MCJ8030007.1 hypothetical protein [Shinella yambaruensis]MCU7984299.1 hypothetical protein [Shinella yambaruensis]GLR55127.1 hypothetical protein GCM10007923_63480 [Shinella yambaruensis]
MNFSEAAKIQMAGGTVRAALLLELQFTSGNEWLWEGGGPIKTLDGRTWEGTGGLGSIEGISQAVNGVAPEVRFRLSGVDADFAAKAKGETEEYLYRPALIYIQFFDEAWQPLDNPYSLMFVRMTGLAPSFESTDAGRVYEVAVTAETPFAVRRRAPYGYLTDRDQQLRHPGDRGLERVAGIDNKNIIWPAV